MFDDSGTKVLYLNSTSPAAPPQMFLWSAGDPPPGRQISTISEGVSLAAVSGSAAIAYAVTTSNRVLRVDLSNFDVKELSGRVPVVTSWFFAQEEADECVGTPGSLMVATGSGLTDFGGNGSVQVAGVDAFVVGGSSNTLYFQLPWDFPLATSPEIAPVEFGAISNPVFGTNTTASLCASAPNFVSLPLHQDFHGAITRNDVAQAGEVIHFYMTGLGPVSPPAQTGAVASANPLQRAATPDCQAMARPDNDPNHDQKIVMESLFAGLAPGMIGIYQLDSVLPKSLPPVPQVGGLPPAVGVVLVDCNENRSRTVVFYR